MLTDFLRGVAHPSGTVARVCCAAVFGRNPEWRKWLKWPERRGRALPFSRQGSLSSGRQMQAFQDASPFRVCRGWLWASTARYARPVRPGPWH